MIPWLVGIPVVALLAGAAVVLVTHEPRVAAYADREVIVRDGVAHDLERAA